MAATIIKTVSAFIANTSARVNDSPQRMEYVFDSLRSQLLNDDTWFFIMNNF